MNKQKFLEDKIINLIEMGDEFINSGKEMNEEAFGYFLNLLEATMDPTKEVESGGK